MRDWAAVTDGELMLILANKPERSSDVDRQSACTELYRRYRGAMERFAGSILKNRTVGTKLEPVDIVQEIFAHLLRPKVAGKYSASYPLLPWLLTVLSRKATDGLRKERRHQVTVSDEAAVEDHRVGLDEARVLNRDTVEVLLKGLSDDEKKFVKLYFMEDRKAEEVADRLGWELTAAYREAFRLKHLLKKRLNRLGS